jgi:hypothetical protein
MDLYNTFETKFEIKIKKNKKLPISGFFRGPREKLPAWL